MEKELCPRNNHNLHVTHQGVCPDCGGTNLVDAYRPAPSPSLREAAQEILHLHLCEQEGMSSGQPTREQWLQAVDKLSAALATEIMQEDEKNGLNDHLTSTEANKKRLEESAEQLGESYSREEVIKIMEWVDECVIRHEDSLWELWANMGETDPEEKYTTSQLLDIYNTTKA